MTFSLDSQTCWVFSSIAFPSQQDLTTGGRKLLQLRSSPFPLEGIQLCTAQVAGLSAPLHENSTDQGISE